MHSLIAISLIPVAILINYEIFYITFPFSVKQFQNFQRMIFSKMENHRLYTIIHSCRFYWIEKICFDANKQVISLSIINIIILTSVKVREVNRERKREKEKGDSKGKTVLSPRELIS